MSGFAASVLPSPAHDCTSPIQGETFLAFPVRGPSPALACAGRVTVKPQKLKDRTLAWRAAAAGWVGGGVQGGLRLNWRAGPAQRGHECQSAPVSLVAPELLGLVQEIGCQPPARCLVAAHPHSPLLPLLPHLGHRDQTQLSDRLKFLGTLGLPHHLPLPWNPDPRWGHALLPLSGSKGFSEVARFANWKKKKEKVRAPLPGTCPCP